MIGTKENLAIEHSTIQWNDVIENLVVEKLDPACGVAALKKQVQDGHLTLVQVTANEIFIGCFFARIEIMFDGKEEFVVTHGIAAHEIPIPFSSVLNPIFDKIALDANIKTIRIHSDQKGIDHLLESNGYKEIERVFRKTL